MVNQIGKGVWPTGDYSNNTEKLHVVDYNVDSDERACTNVDYPVKCRGVAYWSL